MMHVHDVVAAPAAASTRRSSASLASLRYMSDARDTAAAVSSTPALLRRRSDVTTEGAPQRKSHATPRNSGSAAAAAATPPPQVHKEKDRRAVADVADGGDDDDDGSGGAGFSDGSPLQAPCTREDSTSPAVSWCHTAEEPGRNSAVPRSGRHRMHTPPPPPQRDARHSVAAVPGAEVKRTLVPSPPPCALASDAVLAAPRLEAPLVGFRRRQRRDAMPETPTQTAGALAGGGYDSDSSSVSVGLALGSVATSALHSTAETQWHAASTGPTVSGVAELYELPLPFLETAADDLTVVSSLTNSSLSTAGAVGGSMSPVLGKPRAAVCAPPAAAASGPTRTPPSVTVPVSIVRNRLCSTGVPHGVVKLAERSRKRSSDDSTQRSDKSVAVSGCASRDSRVDSHSSTGGEASLQAPAVHLERSGMWSAGTSASLSISVRRVEPAAAPTTSARWSLPSRGLHALASIHTPECQSPVPLGTATRDGGGTTGASLSLQRNSTSLDSHLVPGVRMASLSRLGGQPLSGSCRGKMPPTELAKPLDEDAVAQSYAAASWRSLLSGSNSMGMPMFLTGGSTATLVSFTGVDSPGVVHGSTLTDARRRSARQVDEGTPRHLHALPSLLEFPPQRAELDLDRPPLSPRPVAETSTQLMSPVMMTAPPIPIALRPSPSTTFPPERNPDRSEANATPLQLQRLQSSTSLPPSQHQRLGRQQRKHPETNALEGASLNSLSGPRQHSLRNFTVTSTTSFVVDNPGSGHWQRSRGGAPSMSLQDSAISMWQSSTLLSDHILQTLANGMALGGLSTAPWQAATTTTTTTGTTGPATVAEDNVTTPPPNALARNAAVDPSGSLRLSTGKGHGLPRSLQHHHHHSGGGGDPAAVVPHASHRHAHLQLHQLSPVSPSASSDAHAADYAGQSGSPNAGPYYLATSFLVPLVHGAEMSPRLGGGSRSRTPLSRACSPTLERGAARAMPPHMWPPDVHSLCTRQAASPSAGTQSGTPASRGESTGFPNRSPVSASRAASCTTTVDSTATADSPSSPMHHRTPSVMLAANAAAMVGASSAGVARLGAGRKPTTTTTSTTAAAAHTPWSRRPLMAGNFFATADGSLRDAGAMSPMFGAGASLPSGLESDRSLVTPVRGHSFVHRSTATSRVATTTSVSQASLLVSPPLSGGGNAHVGRGARRSAGGSSLLSQAPLGQEGVMFSAVATPNLLGGGYPGDSMCMPTPSAPTMAATATTVEGTVGDAAYGTASPPAWSNMEHPRSLRWPVGSEATLYRVPSSISSGPGVPSTAGSGAAGQAAPLQRSLNGPSTFLQSVHDVSTVAAQATASASFSYGAALQRLLAAGAGARGAAAAAVAAAGTPASSNGLSSPPPPAFLAAGPSLRSGSLTSAAAAAAVAAMSGGSMWPRSLSVPTRGSTGADSSLAIATAVPSSSLSETRERTTTGPGVVQVSQPVAGSCADSPAETTLTPAPVEGTAVAGGGAEATAEEPHVALQSPPVCLTTEHNGNPSSPSMPTFAPRQGSGGSTLAATIRSPMPGIISVRDRPSARLSDVTGSPGLPVLPLAEEERTTTAGMSLSGEPSTPRASKPSDASPAKEAPEEQVKQHSQWWAPVDGRAAAAFSSPSPDPRATPLHAGIEPTLHITPPDVVRPSPSGYPLPLPQRLPQVDAPLTGLSGSAAAYSTVSGSRGAHPLVNAAHAADPSLGSTVASATPFSTGGSLSSALGHLGGGGGGGTGERTEERGQSRRANRGTLFHHRGTLVSVNSGSPTGGLHVGGGGGWGRTSNGVASGGPRGAAIQGSPNGDGHISIPRYRRHHDVEVLLDDAERAMNRNVVPIIPVLGLAGRQRSSDASLLAFPEGGPIASVLSVATPPGGGSTVWSETALLSYATLASTSDKAGVSGGAGASLSNGVPARP